MVRRYRARKKILRASASPRFPFLFQAFGGQIPDQKRVGYLPHLWGERIGRMMRIIGRARASIMGRGLKRYGQDKPGKSAALPRQEKASSRLRVSAVSFNECTARVPRTSLFRARRCRAFILPILPILLRTTSLSSTQTPAISTLKSHRNDQDSYTSLFRSRHCRDHILLILPMLLNKTSLSNSQICVLLHDAKIDECLLKCIIVVILFYAVLTHLLFFVSIITHCCVWLDTLFVNDLIRFGSGCLSKSVKNIYLPKRALFIDHF